VLGYYARKQRGVEQNIHIRTLREHRSCRRCGMPRAMLAVGLCPVAERCGTEPKVIIFMGLAGSGKSTQGQILAAYLHCPWVSTGNLLREHNFDAAIQKQMLKGEIIDDSLTLKVLGAELTRLKIDKNQCILDGSPRTLSQAQWLVKEFGDSITAVINLKTSEATAKTRLLARHRPDDHEAAIAERFGEYDTKIKPILKYLRDSKIEVFEIDGDQALPAVAGDIVEALGIKAI